MTDEATRIAAHGTEILALIDEAARQPDPLGARARTLRARLAAHETTSPDHTPDDVPRDAPDTDAPDTDAPGTRLPGDTFFTDEGTSLLWTNWGQWADHKDPDKADITLDAGADGWPLGPDGPLAGTLFQTDGAHERRD